MPQPKTEFRNATEGTIGVVTIEPGGREVALPLVAGATIWLTEDEQIATANAPARDEENPFANGDLERVSDPSNRKNRRPIGVPQEGDEAEEAAARQRQAAEEAAAQRKAEEDQQRKEEAQRLAEGQKQAQRGGAPPAPKRQSPDETGAPPQPQGKAAQGSRAAGEEVGTPEAVSP